MKLRRDRIAVALDHRVLIYNFADLRLIYQWETIHNGNGLLAVSSQVDNTVVACPGVHVGQVWVLHSNRVPLWHVSARALPCSLIIDCIIVDDIRSTCLVSSVRMVVLHTESKHSPCVIGGIIGVD